MQQNRSRARRPPDSAPPNCRRLRARRGESTHRGRHDANSSIKTADDLASYVRERNLDYVKVGVFDVDGVMRGKYMGRDKFLSSLEKGFGFCDVVLGWDSNDQLYDNVDADRLAHRLSRRRRPPAARDRRGSLPFEDDLPLVLGEFAGRA